MSLKLIIFFLYNFLIFGLSILCSVIFKNNKYYKKIKFIPNPVDKAIDNLKNYKYKNLEFDIISATSHGQNRVILKKGKSDEREKFINDLYDELTDIKFALFGINQFEPIWGANFFYYLSKSKMALNISRGSYQKLYSSDRISSLIGNGLLVFINKATEFKKLFNNNEIVFFDNKKDLIEIPKTVLDSVEIIPVKNVDEVLKVALTKNLKRVEWVEVDQISKKEKLKKELSTH